MSWTTKEGSSSASGQSPLHFPLSEFARREVALTPHDARTSELRLLFLRSALVKRRDEGCDTRRGARPWESLSAKEAFTFSKDLADRTGAMAKSRSLSWRLGVSTLLIVLPLALFALIMVGWIAHTEREEEKNQLIGQAYAFADAVGREIHSYFLLSAALSHSKLLQHGDLTGFAEQARDTLADAPGVKLIVSTPEGEPVLGIPPAPSDSPLLRGRAALVRRAIASGSAFLSDVNADPALPEANASIETPVLLDGKPVYEIAMLLPLKPFRDLMQRQNFPSNWLSGIVDREGAFVARIPSESARPGTFASAEFRDATRACLHDSHSQFDQWTKGSRSLCAGRGRLDSWRRCRRARAWNWPQRIFDHIPPGGTCDAG